jgi:predicted transcriptional regulator
MTLRCEGQPLASYFLDFITVQTTQDYSTPGRGKLEGRPMEVQFSPEKEARLQDFATRTGRDASQLVVEAVDRLLEYDARFIEAVEEGRATARRGELLDHDEVVARIEGMFQS